MKIVFLGTPAVAAQSLTTLDDAGHHVAAVVTQPDRPSGRSRRPQSPPVKLVALERGLEVLQPTRLGADAFLERVRAADPELLVVVAYGRILRPRLLGLARGGAINLHFSLLPKYRGAAPVQWALARGETGTGVTTMQINERLDEGDVLLQREVAIEAGECAPALQQRLAAVGGELLVETLERLSRGALEPRPQDHSAASYAPVLKPEDGEFDPRLTAAEIDGRIRGFDPWPGVWARRRGQRIRLLAARIVDSAPRPEPPGTVIEPGRGRLGLVCTGAGLLELLRVQPEGRRALDAREAINGRQLQPGDVLG